MNFHFSRYGLTGKEQKLERWIEAAPGLTSWSILIGLTVFAFSNPLWAAAIIIVLDFYFLLRLFFITLFLVLAYFRLSLEEKTDWFSRIREMEEEIQGKRPAKKRPSILNWKKRMSDRIHRIHMGRLLKNGCFPPAVDAIYHLVIIPVSVESDDVIEPGIIRMVEGAYPANRIALVLAVEARAREEIHLAVKRLHTKYHRHFMDFKIIFHPDKLEGEARVKGANVTYAAKQASEYFLEKKIPFENVIVSCFDADTVVSANYFSCLTYSFMVCPNRTRASFQPIPVYHNNIWEVPGFARVLEMGSSFFQLSEATNPEKLVTFSSHSMSFKALVDVGYWPVDMISDDSAIFWKCYIHFDGDYRVVPMYVTVSMDVASADSLWKTAVNIYKQKRRWAWGVENFPIVMRAFLKAHKISWFHRARLAIKLFENHISWATWPFLLTVVSWLPALFAGREFSSSVLYYNAPRITSTIFHLASLSLLTTIILSLCLLPKKKIRETFFMRVWHAFEWLFIPAIAIFFSGLPALDAQTRLMFGKYMEFWVTEKKRKESKGI